MSTVVSLLFSSVCYVIFFSDVLSWVSYCGSPLPLYLTTRAMQPKAVPQKDQVMHYKKTDTKITPPHLRNHFDHFKPPNPPSNPPQTPWKGPSDSSNYRTIELVRTFPVTHTTQKHSHTHTRTSGMSLAHIVNAAEVVHCRRHGGVYVCGCNGHDIVLLLIKRGVCCRSCKSSPIV